MVKTEEIVSKAWELLDPLVELNGYELVEVEFSLERGHWVLRLYVDREGGITLGECAELSEEISRVLDVEDIVDRSYVLEVSSPGLDRPLRKEKDFKKVVGRKIKVTMKEPVDGRKNFSGRLLGVDSQVLHVEAGNQVFPLEMEKIKKANLVYEFNDQYRKRG